MARSRTKRDYVSTINKGKSNDRRPFPYYPWGTSLHTSLPTLLYLHSNIRCRLPLLCSLASREYSGPGTVLLTGTILLLPSHCPEGSSFFVAFFHAEGHWVDCLKLVQETGPDHELGHNCASLRPRQELVSPKSDPAVGQSISHPAALFLE